MQPYYERNGIVIFHADAREVLPTLPAGLVDLVLTDPPYGVEFAYASYEDGLDSWRGLFLNLVQWAKANAQMLLMPICRIDQLGWICSHHVPDWLIAWHKGSPGQRSFVGFSDWEPILVYGKTQGCQMHDHFYAQPANTNGHPCPKPVRWAAWLMERASKPSHLVLDPFMGSGTTLVAAQQLGRRAIGVEIEERYCEIAVKRLQQEVLPL